MCTFFTTDKYYYVFLKCGNKDIIIIKPTNPSVIMAYKGQSSFRKSALPQLIFLIILMIVHSIGHAQKRYYHGWQHPSFLKVSLAKVMYGIFPLVIKGFYL